MRPEWLPHALDDLKRLYKFIHPHSPTAAIRAVTALVEAAETVVEFPETGRPFESDTKYRERLVRFGAKGYVLRYRVEGEQVYIVRIWHASEDR